MSDDITYQFTHGELETLLAYCVHRADCDLVVYRADSRQCCTCGMSNAMRPIREQSSLVPAPLRLASNPLVFSNGSRSIPGWLTRLVQIRYQPVTHRGRYQPGSMSDG